MEFCQKWKKEEKFVLPTFFEIQYNLKKLAETNRLAYFASSSATKEGS
jgi:hypothetical protein